MDEVSRTVKSQVLIVIEPLGTANVVATLTVPIAVPTILPPVIDRLCKLKTPETLSVLSTPALIEVVPETTCVSAPPEARVPTLLIVRLPLAVKAASGVAVPADLLMVR